jgi:hypothetical protein
MWYRLGMRVLSAIGALSLVLGCGAGTGGSGGGSTTSSGGSTTSTGGSTGFSCEAVCPAVVAAMCDAGPPNEAECVRGCETLTASSCADLYIALFDCGGEDATFSCSASGQVNVVGCDAEATELYNCLAGL